VLVTWCRYTEKTNEERENLMKVLVALMKDGKVYALYHKKDALLTLWYS